MTDRLEQEITQLKAAQELIGKITLTTRQIKKHLSSMNESASYKDVSSYLEDIMVRQNLKDFRHKYPESGVVDYYEQYFGDSKTSDMKHPSEFFKDNYLDNILEDNFYLLTHLNCISIAAEIRSGERLFDQTIEDNMALDPSVSKFFDILMNMQEDHLLNLNESVMVSAIKKIVWNNVNIFISAYEHFDKEDEFASIVRSAYAGEVKLPSPKEMAGIQNDIVKTCARLSWSAKSYAKDSFHDMVSFSEAKRSACIINRIGLADYVNNMVHNVDSLFETDHTLKGQVHVGSAGFTVDPDLGFDERLAFKVQLKKVYDRITIKACNEFKAYNREIVSLVKPYENEGNKYVDDIRKIREDSQMGGIVKRIRNFLPDVERNLTKLPPRP